MERVIHVVIADPGFKQIAENIQFTGLAGASGKKLKE